MRKYLYLGIHSGEPALDLIGDVLRLGKII